MGLDICVHQRVQLVEKEHPLEDENGHWCGDDGHIYIEGGRLGGLKQGRCYESIGMGNHFHAGSYGGYSAWRNALSEAAIGVPAADVWNNTAMYSIAPFYELIDFSDCEGIIGPSVAKKLAKDFRIQRETVRPRLEKHGEWFVQQYDNWQAAFELAAGEGLVEFA